MDTLDWQNGFEALLTDRTVLADNYIKMAPVPSTTKGRLVLEDNSSTNYEIIHFTSKDAGGVYTTGGGARNEDGNSTGIHARGARVRMNITSQDMKAMRDAVQFIEDTYASATVGSTATNTTITPSTNIYSVTALGSGATIAAPSLVAADGKVLVLRIKDNGTTRALTFNSIYQNVSGLDMLATTVPNKWHIICCMYNTTAVKWQIVSITTEV